LFLIRYFFIRPMIQKETILQTRDNSGVNFVKCIKLFGGIKKNALLCESVLVVIKNFKHRKRFKHIVKKKASILKKKNKILALIVGTKKRKRRKDGSFFFSDGNKVLLVTPAYVVLGTRIYGFVPKELKRNRNKYSSVVSLAKSSL
jgi:large subunit ribosomal protein L14